MISSLPSIPVLTASGPTLMTVSYCPHCDGPLFEGKDVAVIGGGNSGVEAAIDLAGICKSVTVLEYGESLKADSVLQERLNSLPNTTVITHAATQEIKQFFSLPFYFFLVIHTQQSLILIFLN
ncbi:NAD-binding protein, partial [Staphylococcus pseudintermedius]|uniref:NAD-binding protein n=1 Tax=Staphylococcus pseudintermedius TaxID=283734 RepID=UPI00358E4A47